MFLALLVWFMFNIVGIALMAFGALMVLMMIWRPQGLLPMQRPHLELKP